MVKNRKLFVSLLVFLLTIGLAINVIYAKNASEVLGIRDELVSTGADGNIAGRAETLGKTFTTIFKVAGVGIAVIMLIVLAMKYMFSAPGDKATIKKHAIVYIVGAVILFGASGLMAIFERFSGLI